jgi:virginiamycin B lyase
MRVHRYATIAIALLGALNATQPGAAAVDAGGRASDEVRITEFPLPDGSLPGGIVSGPDGALWFYETGTNQIARISTDGQITEFAIPTANASEPYQGFVGVGPDKAIYFTENRTFSLGKLTLDGQLEETPIEMRVRNHSPNASGNPLLGIAAGPDGAIWFTGAASNSIWRLSVDGVQTEFVLPTPNATPGGLVAGADGAMWFTEPTANQIGRITLVGAITEYPIPTPGSFAVRLASGPDGAVWFAEIRGNNIGRITPAGEIQEFPVPGMAPVGIAPGTDGAVWFTGFASNEIGRLSADGTVQRFAVPTPKSVPYHIVAGPDGALWFTEQEANKIGRLEPPVASTPPLSSAPSLEPLQTLTGSPEPFAALPNGLAVDHQGNIYVGEDSVNGVGGHVHVFDAQCKPLATWGGGPGSGAGQFNYITALAVDEQDNVYVADFENTRIQKFDAQGQFLTQWATESPAGPTGLALDSAGHVYVLNHRRHDHYVQKFDTSGRLLLEWGANGSGPGEFIGPASGGPGSVAVDADGNIYATDPNNYRVQKFDPDGNILTAFGSIGQGPGQFIAGPYGLAVDAAGHVYASDLTVRVIDSLDTYRDLLGSALDTYLSIVSNDVSQTVKKMTAVTAILMVNALIAGVYGMNFEVMPELKWTYARATRHRRPARASLRRWPSRRPRAWRRGRP